MTELEKIEPKKTVLKIGGRERELKFNFSAWKEIEKKYGSVNNIEALVKDIQEKPFQTLPEIVYITLTDKEGLDKESCLDEYGMREMQDRQMEDALDAQRINRLAHFDVPGHKGGRMNPELPDYFGKLCMSLDVNSMKPLDNLGHPVSVIKDAQELAAEAFGADNAFFMVNGTTSAVQTMIWASCGRGEKIILPRNVHRSAINALVVNGAVPIYINPGGNTSEAEGFDGPGLGGVCNQCFKFSRHCVEFENCRIFVFVIANIRTFFIFPNVF